MFKNNSFTFLYDTNVKKTILDKQQISLSKRDIIKKMYKDLITNKKSLNQIN